MPHRYGDKALVLTQEGAVATSTEELAVELMQTLDALGTAKTRRSSAPATSQM